MLCAPAKKEVEAPVGLWEGGVVLHLSAPNAPGRGSDAGPRTATKPWSSDAP